MNKKGITTTEGVLATALVLVVIVAAAIILSMIVTIHTTGTINAIGIGVYSNSNCTAVVTSIDWGRHNPGDIIGVLIYVKNIQNTNVVMTLSESNWIPTYASKYMALSWNYTGTVLIPAQIMLLQLRLSLSSSTFNFTSYSFDININATQHA